VNHLAPVDTEDSAVDGECWHLPQHAHVVVYDSDDRELLTIYDCGAAQKPPSAQLLGNLVTVHVDHELTQMPTGYTVSLRERAALEQQDDDHYVIRERN
jgi:predicted RNA-binding protein with PIN domain